MVLWRQKHPECVIHHRIHGLYDMTCIVLRKESLWTVKYSQEHNGISVWTFQFVALMWHVWVICRRNKMKLFAPSLKTQIYVKVYSTRIWIYCHSCLLQFTAFCIQINQIKHLSEEEGNVAYQTRLFADNTISKSCKTIVCYTFNSDLNTDRCVFAFQVFAFFFWIYFVQNGKDNHCKWNIYFRC